ncbi:MAG: DNRLRE domain-containing protein [Actinomycetes bacterium]|jgi:hypothetical protein|nr:DNRLRE domain-containing protein [Actinomycetes bacterium]
MKKLMKMSSRRILYSACVVFLVAGFTVTVCATSDVFARSGHARGPHVRTVKTQGTDVVATSWLAQSTPKENVSHLTDASYLKVGISKNGKANIGLIHFDLPAGITAKEVIRAELRLKKKSGVHPRVIVGAARKEWAFVTATYRDMAGKTRYARQAPCLRAQNGNWYSANVTRIVKEWLSGKAGNYGFALKGTRKGQVTKFVSAYADRIKDYPALEITYRRKQPTTSYGKYGYTKQSTSKGNCFSYALRDTNAIFLNDILTPAQKQQLQNLSNERTPEAAQNYFKQRVFDYLRTHQQKLGIQSWRALSSSTQKIDPKKEYLVAFKTGFVKKGYGSGADGSYLLEEDFDYHWRVRLKDGRWAEKITHTPTRIVPGSNWSYSAARYPWDSDYLWGYERFNSFYTSKPTYIAIAKKTDAFTAHKR